MRISYYFNDLVLKVLFDGESDFAYMIESRMWKIHLFPIVSPLCLSSLKNTQYVQMSKKTYACTYFLLIHYLNN